MQTTQSKKIVILGGGTAGWMAANLLAKSWQGLGMDITLVESPSIATIGVGEGSTPQLKGFMDFIGAEESDWMPKCNATYKNGIRFKNWSTKPGFKDYFHPFPAQPDDFSAPAFFHNSFVRRKGIDVDGHPDPFFLATYLAEQKLGPIAAYHFPFEINYGYHFDSGLLGQYLAGKAQGLGVKTVKSTIQQVELQVDGAIKRLIGDGGEVFDADIFIDCSGFVGYLIQKQLKVPFVSFANNLFNDSAVVIATDAQAEPESQTTATALNHGWMWNIPLTQRTGNGYVYSSRYCTAESAEQELKQALNLQNTDTSARHLKMKVGRLQQHWYKNCVAIGLSQGFIEPLEATALHLVQESVQGFIDCYQKGQFTAQYQTAYNNSINQRFEAIRDYIVAHYKVNSRTATDYWRDNANNNHLSPSLISILQSWVGGQNLSDELAKQKIDNYYPSVSWHCLLAGYGLYPEQRQLVKGNDLAHQYDTAKIKDYLHRCGINFKSHYKLLADMELNRRS